MILMPGRSFSGPLPPLSDAEAAIRDNLEKHLHRLADEIGERNLWRFEALQKAAEHICDSFQSYGYAPLAQEFSVEGKAVRNIEVI
ncbi:MAG: aminopeptidase, partial [Planctomycetales bacterium]|nr:aminopeptidase [Planctomycetales bacterium]